MKYNILFVMVFISSCSSFHLTETDPDGVEVRVPFDTSVVRIITHPDKYHNENVSVGGYIFTGEEKMVLCLHLDSVVTADCLRVTGISMEELSPFNGKSVVIFGRLNMKNSAYRLMHAGSIDVNKIEEAPLVSGS